MLDRLSQYYPNEKFFEWILILFGVTLPMGIQTNHTVIIFILLLWLLSSSKKLTIKWSDLFLLFLPVYFLIEILSLIYSDNLSIGLKVIEKHSLFILMPLTFSVFNLLKNPLKKFSLGFVIGCVIISVIFAFNYFKSNRISGEALSDSIINEIIPLHASYFSLYLATCILLLKQFYENSRRQKISVVLLILFFAVVVTLSASKLGLFFLLVSLSFFFFYLLRSTSRLRSIVIIFALIISITLVAFKSELILLRFKNIMTSNLELDPVKGYNTLSGRFFFWGCSLEVIQKNYVGGVGIGDAQGELNQCYIKNQATDYVDEYNAHSQYLQTTMEVGIVGLLILVIGFWYMLKTSFKIRAFEILIVTIFFIVFCFFESVFVRDKGVVFLTFFACMLNHSFLKSQRQPDLP
jgi:O-antigen ligase